jgi:Fur family ferric uptake transcriptional regulator
MKTNIIHLLKEHNLRNTETRVEVLKMFTQYSHALTHSDIEKKLGTIHDRVTIYRTLTAFLDSGLIHKVLDNEGSIKYALCNHEHAHQGAHNENHIHFKCKKCSVTECLDHFPVPEFNLPKGYQVSEINLLVEGICKKCN